MSLGQKYFDVYTTWVEQQVKTGQGLVEAMQGIDTFDPSLSGIKRWMLTRPPFRVH